MFTKRKHKIEDGVVHVNRQWHRPCPNFEFPPILATILNFNVATIITLGFLLSLCTVTIFACIYWAIDQNCYVASDVTYGQIHSVTFQKMFALSAQTFTTVGYGGIYVRCVSTNILVTLEWYISLLLGATVTGILIVNLLSPHPMIRWSKHVLLTKWREKLHSNSHRGGGGDDEEEEGANDTTAEVKKCLTFRVVSQSSYQLTSFRIEAVAFILRIDDNTRLPIGTFIEPLTLLHSENVIFHQFGAAHVIDENTSPLYPILADGKWELLQKVVCTATYHDPRFKSDCVSYHTYWNKRLNSGCYVQIDGDAGAGGRFAP